MIPSRIEIWLDSHASAPREKGGSYNAIISDSKFVWRVSKGDDIEERAHFVKDWIVEHEIATILGELGISPRVLQSYSEGSWLTETRNRVAMKFLRYTGDLEDIMWEHNLDASQGEVLAKLLIKRFTQLGSLHIVHGDIHYGNMLILLKDQKIKDVKLIDFDPKYLILANMYKDNQTCCEFATILNVFLLWLFLDDRLALFKCTKSRREYTTVPPWLEPCVKYITKYLKQKQFDLGNAFQNLPRYAESAYTRWLDRVLTLPGIDYASLFPNLFPLNHTIPKITNKCTESDTRNRLATLLLDIR